MDCRNEKGFEMKKNIVVVLCWLAIVLLMIAGCTTTGQVGQAVPAEPHITKEVILPKQEAWCPFWVRKANSGEYFWKKDLMPANVVLVYIEVMEKRGKLPLRAREGFISKQNGKWVILRNTSREYYIIDLNKVM